MSTQPPPIATFMRNIGAAAARIATAPDPYSPDSWSQMAALLSLLQSRTAERPVGSFDGIVTNTRSVTPFAEANQNGAFASGVNAQDFAGSYQLSTMLVALTPASGEVRYLAGGDEPTATHGLIAPAGGGLFTVRGTINIQTFALIATTVTPAAWAMQIFAAPPAMPVMR